MVDRTSHSGKRTREDVAAYLRSLADELEAEDRVSIRIGNKSVHLQPPSELNFTTEVRERSRLIGKRKESIVLELSWSGT